MQADELRSDNRAAKADADVDPTDGRDESLNERMDRNWNEILQELRVTQTGTQIFTGFLLTIAFQARFSELTTFQIRTYLVLVDCRGTDYRTRLGARKPAPWLVPQGRKDDRRADRAHHRADRAGGCRGHADRTVLLIFDLVVGRTAALVMAGVTLLVVIIIAALPLILRGRRQADSPAD